jgi:beta-lactamase class A
MRIPLGSVSPGWRTELVAAILVASTIGASQTFAQDSTSTAAPAPGPTQTPAAIPSGTPTPTSVRTATPTFTASPTSSVPVPPVLRAVAARHQARLGIYVYHFGTGEVLQLNADQRFRAASLYKLVVLYDAYLRLAAGTLSPNEVLTMSQAALDAEPYAEWPLGARTTVACALDSMITISSNAAAAMLLERLGGEPQVTINARSWGLSENTEITKERAFTSPRDVAHLLIAIATDQAVSPEASASMRGILAAQRRNDRIPLPLPPDVAVAHKTGELVRLRHDAGIVYAPSGPYLVVAMAEGAPSDAAARAAILDLSRELYTHFEHSAPPTYLGLPARVALEVLQRPDELGRLVPLNDPWAGTVALREAGVNFAAGAEDATLREFVVPDLLALQRAAIQAGAPFWVTAGYREPRASEARFVDPSASDTTCTVEIPPRAPSPTGEPSPAGGERGPGEAASAPSSLFTAAQSTPQPTAEVAPAAAPPPPSPTGSALPTPTPVPLTSASQHWLGTTIAVTDTPTRNPAVEGAEPSATARWLVANAWQYGFIPALPESPLGRRLGYEPWRLRWVGRELAGQLRNVVSSGDYAGTVTAALRQAELDAVASRR